MKGARRFGLLLTLIVLVVVFFSVRDEATLQVVFLDVGQGDAIFIRAPEGQTALIDGGESGAAIADYLSTLGVTQLDLMVASHAHFDHIGGLIDTVAAYPPKTFMDNGIPHTSQAYQDLLRAVDEAGSTYLEASERSISLGSVTLRVLPPPHESDEQNENSVGIYLSYGDFEALLLGDATSEEQAWWLARYPDLLSEVEVYKASHHGSRTGDEATFLRTLSPEVVVISAGLDNSYGHPHQEALSSYHAVDASIYRTDQLGSITISVPKTGMVGYEVFTGEVRPNAKASVKALLAELFAVLTEF